MFARCSTCTKLWSQDYLDPLPDHGSTFGFRKSAIRGLRSIDAPIPAGGSVFSGRAVRAPHSPMLTEWWSERPLQAGCDFALPAKTIFFFSLLPMMLMLAALGGIRVACGYAGAIAFGSLALALRGRSHGAHASTRRCGFSNARSAFIGRCSAN